MVVALPLMLLLLPGVVALVVLLGNVERYSNNFRAKVDSLTPQTIISSFAIGFGAVAVSRYARWAARQPGTLIHDVS